MNQDKPDLSDSGKNKPVQSPTKDASAKDALAKDVPAKDALATGTEIEDFFQKMSGNFRWPKPDAAAVAAAEEAIHRLSGGPLAKDPADSAALDDADSNCSACGGLLPVAARFCVWCGVATTRATGSTSPHASTAAGHQHGQQHVHHHYHHIVPARETTPQAPAEVPAPAARGRAPGSPGTSPGGRAEASARQVVQDWAQACNTKHIDDLLELYSADATLIRSSVPPVRSLPAIRSFLVSLLEAGLGDVEMESMRLEVLGDVALDLGRCKMLVPVAMGKRREERGKYLIVLVRQPAGTWKILADCWSADLAVNVNPSLTDTAARTPSEPIRQVPPAARTR